MKGPYQAQIPLALPLIRTEIHQDSTTPQHLHIEALTATGGVKIYAFNNNPDMFMPAAIPVNRLDS